MNKRIVYIDDFRKSYKFEIIMNDLSQFRINVSLFSATRVSLSLNIGNIFILFHKRLFNITSLIIEVIDPLLFSQ